MRWARASSGHALSVGMRLAESTSAARMGWPRSSTSSRAAQFEECRALAVREGKGGGDVGAAGGRVVVGVGQQPQQFGVVEAHPGFLGQRQRGVESFMGRLGWPAAINTRARTASKKVM
jgi:hypothetical protein